MDAAGFKDAFNARYYAAVGISAASWTDDEIDEFLNKAQRTLIDLYVGQGDYKKISNLLDTSTTVDPGVTNNKASVTLAIVHFIEGRVKLIHSQFNSGSADFYPVEEIATEDINRFLPSAVNKTIFRTPKIAVSSGGITLIVDSYSSAVADLEITYIKPPLVFDLNGTPVVVTDLNENLHNNIVELAVESAVRANTKINQSKA